MNYKVLGIILGITVLQILLFSVIFLFNQTSCGDKIVKCYDRNNNEIIGQTCQQSDVECLDGLVLILVIVLGSLWFLSFNLRFFWSDL